MRSTKTLPLVLERELYERIERDALEQERDAVQQCRYLIRRALEAPKAVAGGSPDGPRAA